MSLCASFRSLEGVRPSTQPYTWPSWIPSIAYAYQTAVSAGRPARLHREAHQAAVGPFQVIVHIGQVGAERVQQGIELAIAQQADMPRAAPARACLPAAVCALVLSCWGLSGGGLVPRGASRVDRPPAPALATRYPPSAVEEAASEGLDVSDVVAVAVVWVPVVPLPTSRRLVVLRQPHVVPQPLLGTQGTRGPAVRLGVEGPIEGKQGVARRTCSGWSTQKVTSLVEVAWNMSPRWPGLQSVDTRLRYTPRLSATLRPGTVTDTTCVTGSSNLHNAAHA